MVGRSSWRDPSSWLETRSALCVLAETPAVKVIPISSKRLLPVSVVLYLMTTQSLVVAHEASAQTPVVRVEQLRTDPQAHLNQIRSVEGVVERLVSRGADSAPAFYLEDDYGHQVLVVPSGVPPERGARLTVRGVVTLDAVGDPVLTMLDGVEAEDPVAADPSGGLPELPAPDADADGVVDALDTCPDTPREAQADATGCAVAPTSRLGLLSTAAGGLVLLVVVGAFVVRRRRAAPVEVPIAELWPPDSQEFDGRTMRFTRPDPTLHLIPGKLEVTGGDDAGEVIRFVGVGDEAIEMTFGRASGRGPSHVQLKEKTVSRRHAVIRNRDGAWWLQNLSRTNPTVLNDEELDADEVLLSDEDEIEMGEVSFRFHAR